MAGQAEPGDSVINYRRFELLIVAMGGALAATEPWLVKTTERIGIDWWWRVPFWIRGTSYATLALMILAFGGATQKFIYFDF